MTDDNPNQLGLFDRPTRGQLLQLLSVSDIYQKADQELLAELREDRRLERKPSGTHTAVLGEYYAMWSNTDPDGGLIVIGQENDGAFSGCAKLTTEQLNAFDLTASQFCPDARAQIRRVPVVRTDGAVDFVLLIRVHYHPSKLVEITRGEAYIRRGDQKHRLSDEERLEIRAQKGEVKPELTPAPSYRYPEDFDTTLVEQFIAAARAARSALPDVVSDVELLKAYHLGTIDDSKRFIPNLACVVVFAKDPRLLVPGCTVRFLRYEGEYELTGERYNVVKDVTIEGNIPTLIAKAADVLASQLRTFSRVGDDGRFYTAPEYPPLAWHEGIVNGCAHRSYGALSNMNIFVKMFDNRLEVTSPGGFPPSVTAENIYTSQHPRNPFIMDALIPLSFVKCINEGTKRMRDEMRAMNLPLPVFAQKEVGHSQVRVTLRNNKPQRREWLDRDVADVVGPEIAATLTVHERQIMNHIAEYGSINVSQAAKVTGRRWHTEKKCLERLRARDLLVLRVRRKIKHNPDARYEMKQQPPKRDDRDS